MIPSPFLPPTTPSPVKGASSAAFLSVTSRQIPW